MQAFEENPDADLVIGSRNLDASGYEGYTALRRIASKVYIRLISMAGGFRLSDSQCGIKAFRASAAEAVFSRCETDGFAFDLEALLRAAEMKLSITEVPVRVLVHGDSKVRVVRDTVRILSDTRRIKRRIRAEKRVKTQ